MPLVFRPRAFAIVALGFNEKRARAGAGITLASSRAVRDTQMPVVFDEPTVMWRMERNDGRQAHAVIGPRPDGAVVVWFINGRPLGYRDFDDWTSALRWSDQMRAQNWAMGWRLAGD